MIENKKILVTGADGFIGSHLVEALVEIGCDVRAFVYYNAFNSWGWLDTLSQNQLRNIEVVVGDVRDTDSVNKAVKAADIVFHLAALIGIPYSYQAPESYVDTNIKGTLNILRAVKENTPERLLVTSTSEVYGTAQYVPIDESHPLQPQSPYSATKIAADSLAESFNRSFELPLTIVRPFNTYGPRQSTRAVIPSTIVQLLNGADTIKLGSIHPTRDFNFVTDICRGFIHLANCPNAIGRIVNVGSGTEISIGNMAEILINQINPSAKIVTDDSRVRPTESEVERLVCNNQLIKELTTWEPEVALEHGLKSTVDWLRKPENLARYKAEVYAV